MSPDFTSFQPGSIPWLGTNLWVPKSTWRDSQDSNEMSIPRKEDVPKDRGLKFQVEIRVKLKRNMFPDIQAEFSYHTHFTRIDTLLLDFTPSTEPGIGKLILGRVEREDALRNLGYPPKLLRSPGIIFVAASRKMSTTQELPTSWFWPRDIPRCLGGPAIGACTAIFFSSAPSSPSSSYQTW